MGISIFYFFQRELEEMRVKVLLINTRKLLKKSSKLLKQLEHNPTSQVSNGLTRELKLGEHELFQLYEEEGVSPN